MTYNNAVKHIRSLKSHSKSGGELARRLYSTAIATATETRYVSICGDAGKTSCARMLTSILSECGYKVGYYSYSAAAEPRERIKIKEKDIPHAEFAAIAKSILDTASGDETLTENDIILAIALTYFSSNGCDAIIFERSLSEDAPLIEPPVLSVITSVLDSFPSTYSEHIVPRGTKETVTSIQHKHVYGEISKTCANVGCRLSLPIYSDLEVNKITLFNTRFGYRGGEYSLKTFSPCQLLNAITVIEAAHALARIGMNITDGNIVKGLANSQLPLLCQAITIEPTLIVATVESPSELNALVASLAQVCELLHRRVTVFTSPAASELTADLPARLSTCSIECDRVLVLDSSNQHEFKEKVSNIVAPLSKEENKEYAAVFVGNREFISELDVQIKKTLGNFT